MGKDKASSFILRRTENITKSQEDKRLYRGLELANQMKILLVSNPETDKSAAALNVNVGSLSDPKEVQGVAHFCEHMLSMGTEKYPDENDYDNFLSGHGGSNNAETSSDYTTYYFDIMPDYLQDVLDRFSQFFIAPLFTASAVDREITAVNSEFEKNLPDDTWRILQLNQHLANPDHPYHCFKIGNTKSLATLPKESNLNVRDELLKFHHKWYSSNIMSLAVLGKENLDELEEMVVNLFSKVKNKSVQAPRWEEHPFKEDQLGTCVYVVPVMDIKMMHIYFPCPDLRAYYKSSPSNYLENLIGHGGPGSIQSTLQSRGWVTQMAAACQELIRGADFFKILIELTEDGVNHTDEIIELLFQYINMLKSKGPQKWIQDENRDIANMSFRFQDKDTPIDYVNDLANKLQDYPMEDVLSCKFLFTEWQPEIIEGILKNFVPEKIRVMVASKEFEKVVNEVEPWFGTQYKISKIPKDTLKKWINAGFSANLKLPEKNQFIPRDFQLYPKDTDATQHPVIIKDNALTRVWFKQDEVFLLPKAKIILHFVSPLIHSDTLNCNLTRLLVDMFEYNLVEYGFAAGLAGLTYEVDKIISGIKLIIDGYNDKQHIFLDKVMEKLTNLKIDPKKFEILKSNYIKELKNFVAEVPYSQAIAYMNSLLIEGSYTKQEVLISTDQLTVKKLEDFISQLLSRVHVECMIYGNANKEKALQLSQIVEKRLSSAFTMTPLLPQELLLNRVLKLENSSNYVYNVQNDIYKESAIEAFYQCGLATKENNTKPKLLCQIIEEPCFDVLRTQEQLGYVVYSLVRVVNAVRGFSIIVQSGRNPVYVESRVEAFLQNMVNNLRDMSQEAFLDHKKALTGNILEKPRQLSAQADKYWEEIAKKEYHFDRRYDEVDYLKTLSKDDMISFYKNLTGINSQFRKKISVHIVSKAGEKEEELFRADNLTTPSVVSDVTLFKNSHELYSFIQPYIQVAPEGYKN